jgi:hypothetical protein
LATLTPQQRRVMWNTLRRARVEKIIAQTARTNSDKAAGPIVRVLRDLLMPVAMKRLAKSERTAWQFDYEGRPDARRTSPEDQITVQDTLHVPDLDVRAVAFDRRMRRSGPAPRRVYGQAVGLRRLAP